MALVSTVAMLPPYQRMSLHSHCPLLRKRHRLKQARLDVSAENQYARRAGEPCAMSVRRRLTDQCRMDSIQTVHDRSEELGANETMVDQRTELIRLCRLIA